MNTNGASGPEGFGPFCYQFSSEQVNNQSITKFTFEICISFFHVAFQRIGILTLLGAYKRNRLDDWTGPLARLSLSSVMSWTRSDT